MSKYLDRLENMTTDSTFIRKQAYIDYNFGQLIKSKNLRSVSALEIGPGLGECVSYLNSLGVKEIDVVDKDAGVIKMLKSKFTVRNAFQKDNIINIKTQLKKYDLIIMIQVLEHMPFNQLPKIMKVLFDHLRDNGHILVVVPNANNPLGLVERYGDLQHTTAFTTQALRDLVNNSDIKGSLHIKGYEIPPSSLINLIRVFFQKALHALIFLVMIVNGGTYFRTLTPNICLVIEKNQ